ncbi:MAG: hypothetical protein KDD61_17045 [Bdellovibrionales bacterium]|nr:hypothetical protein [Bdellovibrionales bacterium]
MKYFILLIVSFFFLTGATCEERNTDSDTTGSSEVQDWNQDSSSDVTPSDEDVSPKSLDLPEDSGDSSEES